MREIMTHDREDRGKEMNKLKMKIMRKLAVTALSLFLLGGSVILPGDAEAKRDISNSEEWSTWRSMGSGYIGRKKIVEKDVAASKKRRERKKKMQTRLGSPVDAVWLQTKYEGLYSVPLADVAESAGWDHRYTSKLAKKGRLLLQNDDKPVRYHYDRENDSLLFGAEAFDTFYTDANAFKLSTTSRKKPAVMKVKNGKVPSTDGVVTPFMDTVYFEEEPDWMYSLWVVKDEPDADNWFWDYLFGGYKDSIEISFFLADPSREGIGTLRVNLRGATDLEQGDEHHVFAELNGQQVGTSVVWDDFSEAQLVAEFDMALLDPAGTNTLRLQTVYDEGTHPGQYLDSFEVDYLRMPVAEFGSIWLRNTDREMQKVIGFTQNDIKVIESFQGKSVLRKDVLIQEEEDSTFSASFRSKAGKNYLVADSSGVLQPTLVPVTSSNLSSRRNGADYLIIAPRVLQQTAEQLAEYRTETVGEVEIAWVQDIYNEFSAGKVDPNAIESFMELVNEKWSQVPQYVVILGKASLDHKDRMGFSDSLVPTRMASTPWGIVSSDPRLIGEAIHYSFAIGRIPVTSDEDGVAYVEKIKAHELNVVRSAYESQPIVLAADDPDDAGDFHGNTDLMIDQLLGLNQKEILALYHPDDQVRSIFTDNSTWESSYISFDGHGSALRLGNTRENFFDLSDATALTNSKYPVFTALTCSAGNNMLLGKQSIAGEVVINPHGGAIASIAPSGFSYDSEAQHLGSLLLDNFFLESKSVGEALRSAKAELRTDVSEFMMNSYQIIGDPAVTLW